MQFGSHIELENLRFSVFSTEDVKKLSMVKVVTSILFDSLGHALPGGLYDPAMGPYSTFKGADPCSTCGKVDQCPGHSGHIELCTSVYNPVFIKTIYNILRMSCLSCFKLQIFDNKILIIILQLKLIDAGYDIEARELEVFKTKSSFKFETTDDQHLFDTKINTLNELIEKNPINHYNKTKNTEAIRSAIVNTTIKSSVTKKCICCQESMKNVKCSYRKLVIGLSKADMVSFYKETSNEENLDKTKIKTSNKAILADECRQYLTKIYNSNKELLQLIYPILKYCSTTVDCPVDVFFLNAIPVTPSTVRPVNKLLDYIVEHPQTVLYKKIVDSNLILRTIISIFNESENIIESTITDNTTTITDNTTIIQEQSKNIYDNALGSTGYEKMYNAWQNLQTSVDQLWDTSMNRDMSGKGLKQIIERKTGIIRMYMMGKRVNYAARTVITPDPYINVDEIGVPDKFARKLSYPVPVTTWNVAKLRKLVTNGPQNYPGANLIEDERGYITIIPANDAVKRESLAKTLLSHSQKGSKIVHRHLVNGDVLLLNRQPSLHRPSIMGHRARVLKDEKTFRLHYSNCKSYNADFDGDEMNAHFPQNELGRSEAYNLANVSNQYLVPKDGTPLGGLIQDHVISGVRLSMRGRFFNRVDYQQMVFVSLGLVQGNIETLPPTILKPHKLWSGKQVLSTIIINVIPKGMVKINLLSQAKINAKSWESEKPRQWQGGGLPFSSDSEMSEAEVIIRNGQLLVGVLDKTHYGATPYGLIHCMYELYGGNCSTQLLTAFAKLFTYFLQREGFTLGVKDILLIPDADKKRTKAIKKCRLVGNRITVDALDLPINISPNDLSEQIEENYKNDPAFRTILDRHYKSTLDAYTNKINKICLPAGLLTKFPKNNLQLMVGSGAKGSTVNTMQISCLLGQIELEGKRPPLMISGKSLPCFTATETSPKSGGFIDGRFMTGIQPQDFYFHCMAGREGLIDTAVKTSRSGYLQRCLIKHFEGLSVNYDLTVRDSDNSVIQFYYGEDGMDISKAKFFNIKQLAFLDENTHAILNNETLKRLKNDESIDCDMKRYKKNLRSWNKENGDILKKRRQSNFLLYSKEILPEIHVKNPNKIKQSGHRKIDEKIIKNWIKCDQEIKDQYTKQSLKCPDPITAKFKPDTNFGSLTERIEKLIADYMKRNKSGKTDFLYMMCVKNMMALAAPGEPVGLLAAQSIGEPSTQMTLNTFHFAGRGEMNVTLGIPRLREILMMASVNIKTPSIDIPFQPHINLEHRAEKLRLKFARVTVADVLESINFTSHLTLKPMRNTVITLQFNFLPPSSYDEMYGVNPKQILKHMKDVFFQLMFKLIQKSLNQKNKVIEIDDDGKKTKNKKADKDDDFIDMAEPEEKSMTERNNADSSDEEDINDDDDDATTAKLKGQNFDTNDYDDPLDEEEIQDLQIEDDEMGDEEKYNKNIDDDDDDNANSDEDLEVDNTLKSNSAIEGYSFDKNDFSWCKIIFNLPMKHKILDFSTILKEVARKSVITEVSNIKRAITYVKNNDLMFKTEGINIPEMFKYNKILDLNRLYSNDIHAIAKTYGIEAATKVIVQEVKTVFNVYGITIDSRHLSLIADYMTFDGTFKPLSRRGMESSASPLQQMSFESSSYFLQNATVSGRCDNLDSPSSCLFVGKPCKTGTGAFSLISKFYHSLK